MKYIYHKIDNKPSNYPIFSKNKKPLHALLLSLVVILFMIPNSNASKNKMEKISQINYQDQFEQCQKDYERMYSMLNQKVKEYSDNEFRLLNNVKETILKTYTKGENIRIRMDKELKIYKDRLEEVKRNAKEQIDFYLKLNQGIKKELDDLKFQINTLNKERLVCRNDLENAIKDKAAVENEKTKLLMELNNQKDTYTTKNNRLNNHLNECYEKVKEIELRKNEELKDNKINFTNIDEKINHLDKAVEKNKNESKIALNSQINKGNKIRENLELIDDRIKTIIDNLPVLNNFNSGNIKKELNQIQSDIKNMQSDSLFSNQQYNNKEKYEKVKNSIEEPLETNKASASSNLKKKPASQSKETKFQNSEMGEDSKAGNKPNEKDKFNLNTNNFSDANVFLETNNKSLAKMHEIRLIRKTNEFTDFNREEVLLNRKLDSVLFDNIDQARLLYKKIDLFGELMTSAVRQKTICEDKLDTLNKQNVELKTALAETEIRLRTIEHK